LSLFLELFLAPPVFQGGDLLFLVHFTRIKSELRGYSSMLRDDPEENVPKTSKIKGQKPKRQSKMEKIQMAIRRFHPDIVGTKPEENQILQCQNYSSSWFDIGQASARPNC
jgi:hypothetical protein